MIDAKKIPNCNQCEWLTWALGGKCFKCNINPAKRFDYPMLHGWFCKDYINWEVAAKEIAERNKKENK